MSEDKHDFNHLFSPWCECSTCKQTATYLHEKHLGDYVDPAAQLTEARRLLAEAHRVVVATDMEEAYKTGMLGEIEQFLAKGGGA